MKNLSKTIVPLLMVIFLVSCADVDPGEEGFYYRPYGDGIDDKNIVQEGTHSCAPWNDIITYSVRQQTRKYKSSVMDKNGTEITIVANVNFALIKGKSASMHTRHGRKYPISFVDVKVKGSIKDVIGRYTYEEVYSKKREALESEIEGLLIDDFDENYLALHFVEIADVNLPKNIATEITNKETQKQRNLTAKEKKQEAMNLAEAKIETAKGDSARAIISAMSEAKAMEIKQRQLVKSPQYIEYLKATKWDGSYGTGNVFGAGVTLFKNVR